MSEWQPIETAPKDGTKILLYTVYDAKDDGAFYGCDPFEAVQIGQWDHGNGLSEFDDFYRPAEWDVQLVGEATHWMPLPSPPIQNPKRGNRIKSKSNDKQMV